MVLRASPFVSFLVGFLVVAGAARASVSLKVRAVPVPAARGKAASVSAGRPRSPDLARAQAERERRWRGFPDHYGPRGFDWSRGAGRPRAARERDARARAEAGADVAYHARVAFIRIDFLHDRGGDKSSGDGHFDLSPRDTTRPAIDRPPHHRDFYLAHLEALSRYYLAQSFGRTQIEGDVWPQERDSSYHLPDMADLGPWEFSTDIYPVAVRMFRQMLFAADSQSTAKNDRIPWGDYDRIVLIHAGSDLQSDVRQDSPEDIPSFTIGVADTDTVIFPDDSLAHAFPVDRATIIPETINQDGLYGAINGVVAHECGHLIFGFADLYNVENGFPVVGYWSLMDSGNLVGAIVPAPDGTDIFATGLLPPAVDPWQRAFTTDVLSFREVAYGDTMKIANIERNPDLRKVSLSSDEYLLLENRYIAAADTLELDQDDSTRVVLGPKKPDRFEYDALLPSRTDTHDHLLPSGGVLVWHIDESVIPNEFTFPCDTARANPGCGFNTNPLRRAISVVEADGLGDLGDLGSPFLLGSPYDPYFHFNNPSLSDTTEPNLIPHIGTRPHVRLDFLDDPADTMRFSAFRTWTLPAFPLVADFPEGGPQLLAVDGDGDRKLDICWAGGADSIFVRDHLEPNPDRNALFGVRVDGRGFGGGARVFARLDRRPRPEMAALQLGELEGPSLFAVSTYADGPDTSSRGGRVWLIDRLGAVRAGWPAALPSIVTTPPVIEGQYPNSTVYVGCADGRVYALGLDGTILATSDTPLGGGVTGRLAVLRDVGARSGGTDLVAVAAGGADGDVGAFDALGGLRSLSGWPQRVGRSGFVPDFLWIDFGGAADAGDCVKGTWTLVVHHGDRLWAYCITGRGLPGWGRALGDTLVAGLGAGDPDGDGFPEVLTQSLSSKVTFWNSDGYPSPGWPKPGSREGFRTSAPPLAADVDGDGGSEVVAVNASGIIAALGNKGRVPPGWPLATGLGSDGAPLIADLDQDGTLEVAAADLYGHLYVYSLPARVTTDTVTSWGMLGGDPGRTSALPRERTPKPPEASPGPLVHGSLKAYPNPARRMPVSFAYQLSEPADVEFRIVDTSGHEVASFSRRGRQSDNLEVWDPGRLPAGLYTARLRFRGAGTERIEVLQVGLLR